MFGAKAFTAAAYFAIAGSFATSSLPVAAADATLTDEWYKTLHQVEDVITAFAKKNSLSVNDPLFPWIPTSAPVPTPVTTTKAPYSPRPNPGGGAGQGGQQGGSTGKPKCAIKLNAQDEHNIKLDCDKTDRVRFIGLGDWGEEFIAPYVLGVRDGIIKEAATNTYDFLLAVGDNFYNYGVANVTDDIWRTFWVERWQIGTNLTLPWIAYMGNHDWYGNGQAQIDFSKSSQPGAKYWIMPSKYYSIDATVPTGKKFKITVVDTQTLTSDADFAWAQREYNDPSTEFVIAAGHHHIYSAAKAGDNKTDSMVRLKNTIESNDKVKAYLCGHEHDMQFLQHNNTDYFMFGGGGRTIDEAEVGPGTAANVVYFKKKYGFATFDISLGARTMTVTYHVFNNQGQEIETPTFVRKY